MSEYKKDAEAGGTQAYAEPVVADDHSGTPRNEKVQQGDDDFGAWPSSF